MKITGRSEELSYYWVAEDVGGIFEFADYFISFSNILDCYKHKITLDQFFTWYDYCLENEFINISLAKFILSAADKAKKEKENLKRLEDNVKTAENIFKIALEQYNKK